MASMRRTASNLASGEELVQVISDVTVELTSLFRLRSCFFEVGAPDVDRSRIERTGQLVVPDHIVDPGRPGRRWEWCELPVLGHQQVFGHFVLGFRPEAEEPSPEDLLTAVALGDQVGAAFMAQAPYPPESSPTPNLRVVP
jgi:hypothetical protein